MMIRAADEPSTMPPMIDTHCHLDDRQFSDDLDAVLAHSRSAGVDRWILIGYDPERWQHVIDMAGSIPGMSFTLGVHPSCAEAWSNARADELRSLLSTTGAVGIGECGIDLYRDNAPLEIQSRAFSAQLDLAEEMNLPVIIHLRAAEEDMLALLNSRSTLPTLLFHSFEGSSTLMDFILQTGNYVGIGGLATRSKSEEIRTQLARVPHDRIVLETDSPYLVPARQKDRRNQPAQIRTIALMMADVLGMTTAQLAELTTRNAERLFGLHHD